jgi:predicted DNA-binding transcriptional regulator AlpA
MTETDLPLLVDAKTLAKLLSISPATVWRMLSAGKLPSPLRPSAGIVRWKTEEIRAWVNEGMPDLETWQGLRATQAQRNGRPR